MMEEYICHFRSVQFHSLCKTAGISEADLPTEAKFVKNGKNMLCYSYVLSKCNGKYYGRAQEGHAPASALSGVFVDNVSQNQQYRRPTFTPATNAAAHREAYQGAGTARVPMDNATTSS